MSSAVRAIARPTPAATSARSSARPPSARAARVLLMGMAAGGALLAFRWPTPAGNLTIDRVVGLVTVGFLVLRSRHPLRMPPGVLPLVLAAAGFLGVTCAGLLYTPAFSTGLALTGNVASALFLFFVTLMLVHDALRRATHRRTAELVASAPLWGFLISGFLGIFQATQLLAGTQPSIPFVRFSRLDASTLNSARIAFGTGLDAFNLDRIAGATGDPPTFGTLCALTLAYVFWLRRSSLIRSRGLFWTVVAVASIGVVLSASVTAVLVTAVVLILNRPRNLRGWRTLLLTAAASGSFLVVLVAVVPSVNGFLVAAQTRAGASAAGAAAVGDHVELLRNALDIFVAHPIGGVGAGGLTYQQYGLDLGFSSVHNTLLLALSEGGLISGVILVCLWLLLGKTYVPATILIPSIAAWLIYIDFARLPTIWVYLGAAAGINYWLRRERRQSALAIADGSEDRAGVR